MIYLGISQDLYDAGVCLCDGTHILYAANEERFTRQKNQGGFPRQSLQAAFEHTGVTANDIGQICVAGIMTPPLPARAFPRLQEWLLPDPRPARVSTSNLLFDWLAFHTGLAHTAPDSIWRKLTEPLLPAALRRNLPKPLRRAPVRFVEHHRAHAASAWGLCGFDAALCLTADAMGDGLSMTVSRCDPSGVERLWSASSHDSLGLFYRMMTGALGFVPDRHEGKVTGLAAGGDATRVRQAAPFSWQDGRLIYTGAYGRRALAWAQAELIANYSRADIAAWLQSILESNVLHVARTWLRQTGLRKLVLAGGVFANVKLNQRLHELPEVDELFVCPNMGDGGLSVGAVCACDGVARAPIADVFLGDEFDAEQIGAALQASGLAAETCTDIDARVAALLAAGHIVARFSGRMEWGPRALGNRSVLAPTADIRVVEWLNRLLQRSEFMPFAPAVLDEEAERWFTGLQPARQAAQFMTVCFDATAALRREHAAVVHVDGTVRPQLVVQQANRSLHALLSEYRRLSGAGILLNTSFNIHEEPIVRTPREAIDAFLRARLDYLAIGPFLVGPIDTPSEEPSP